MAQRPRFYGMNPPFLGGARNVMSLQTDSRLIKNDILQLLLTIPGERVYRPNFGTSIRSIVFDNFDDSQISALESDIARAITENDERVKVNGVIVGLVDDGVGLTIKVNISINNDPLSHYLIELAVTPGGVQVSR